MQKVVLYTDTGVLDFDSFDKLFQSISEKGDIIEDIQDGFLTINGQSIPFAIQTTSGSKDLFISQVESYRDELRSYISKLKNQGIDVGKSELQKLAKQFEFLPKKPAETPAS